MKFQTAFALTTLFVASASATRTSLPPPPAFPAIPTKGTRATTTSPVHPHSIPTPIYPAQTLSVPAGRDDSGPAVLTLSGTRIRTAISTPTRPTTLQTAYTRVPALEETRAAAATPDALRGQGLDLMPPRDGDGVGGVPDSVGESAVEMDGDVLPRGKKWKEEGKGRGDGKGKGGKAKGKGKGSDGEYLVPVGAPGKRAMPFQRAEEEPDCVAIYGTVSAAPPEEDEDLTPVVAPPVEFELDEVDERGGDYFFFVGPAGLQEGEGRD